VSSTKTESTKWTSTWSVPLSSNGGQAWAQTRESLSWIRMTRTARQDARRSGKEDAGHSLFLGGRLFGLYGEHNSKIIKGSCRDLTWRGLVVTWRLIRDWSYLLTFRGTHVVCASARVWYLSGGLLPSQHRRRSIVSRVLIQQTNKQTNKHLSDPRGDSGLLRLWLHVLAGIILHHKMHSLVIYSSANSWRWSYVLPSCDLWCPPSNLFTSNKMSSSTRCAWYVGHSQDFPPRAQYMYEKRFHDAKSWQLWCISPTPAPSAIALLSWVSLLHRKWLKKIHEVLNFWNSRNLKSVVYSNSYILLNFHTNKSLTIQQVPRSRDFCT